MIQYILFFWIISGIFAFISFPVTTYIMILTKTDIRPPFIYHLWVVHGIVGGWMGWLKFFLSSIALGPIGFVVYNVTVIKMYSYDDEDDSA